MDQEFINYKNKKSVLYKFKLQKLCCNKESGKKLIKSVIKGKTYLRMSSQKHINIVYWMSNIINHVGVWK